MGSRRHYQGKPHKRRTASQPPPLIRPVTAISAKPKVVFGRPVILLENTQKQVFVYSDGNWVPFERSIADCRLDCQVKELSQKINGMTRYEVSAPVN